MDDAADVSSDGGSTVENESGTLLSRGLRGTASRLRQRHGLLWVALTIVIQAIELILVARISNVLTTTQATFVRGISLIPFAFFISWEKARSYRWTEMTIFISGGLSDNLTYLCSGAASLYIWTGDVAVIQFNTPLPGVLLAWVLFREKLSAVDFVLIIINALGLVLVSEPSFLFPTDVTDLVSSSHALGIILAFGGMVFSLTTTLSARSLPYRNAEDPHLFTTCTGLSGLFLSTSLSLISPEWVIPTTQTEWLLVFGLVVSTLGGLFSYIKSLETESILTVTVLVTLAMLLATLCDIIFAAREVDSTTLCGIAVILGSTFSLFLKDLATDSSYSE